MTKTTINNVSTCLLLAVAAIGCGSPSDDQIQETAKSGSVTVYVDSLIAPVVEKSIDVFRADKEHYKASVTVVQVSAAEAYDKLFAREAKLIVTARGYTRAEDTLMADKGLTFPRTHIATDALVFITSPSSPIDTLSDEDIRAWLSGKPVRLDAYPGLETPPTFVTSTATGSLVENLSLVVLKGSALSPSRLRAATSMAAMKSVIMATPGTIGIAYMSQLGSDTTLKRLRIGFTNASGERIYPQHVHPGYVRMGKYPYAVPIYSVLLERPHQFNLASGVAGYIYQNVDAQKAFLQAGILPEFIKLVLTPQE
jgi:ABC-type phosphate transport system substrate-binding protein